jgi:hypothetical protein
MAFFPHEGISKIFFVVNIHLINQTLSKSSTGMAEAGGQGGVRQKRIVSADTI